MKRRKRITKQKISIGKLSSHPEIPERRWENHEEDKEKLIIQIQR